MTCKCKELLNKKDTECNTPKCEMCWYHEKYEDLKLEAMMVMQEEEVDE